jgi:tetratricopeptide (TPR) repeat protein
MNCLQDLSSFALRRLRGRLRCDAAGEPLLEVLVSAAFRHADDGGGGALANVRRLAAALEMDGPELEALLEEARCNSAGTPVMDEALSCLRQGGASAQGGGYDRAIAEFSAALRADPNLASAYAQRAEVYRLRGQDAPALADCNAALRLDPGDVRTLFNRAQIYCVASRYAEAVADCTAALELVSHNVVAWNHRGVARAAAGDPDGAVADFTEALRLNPSHLWAYLNRGDAQRARGNDPAAEPTTAMPCGSTRSLPSATSSAAMRSWRAMRSTQPSATTPVPCTSIRSTCWPSSVAARPIAGSRPAGDRGEGAPGRGAPASVRRGGSGRSWQEEGYAAGSPPG